MLTNGVVYTALLMLLPQSLRVKPGGLLQLGFSARRARAPKNELYYKTSAKVLTFL